MARRVELYRALWGLSRNPFPDHAIAAAGDFRQPFFENLHPGIGTQMARAFVGSSGAPPSVAFLWSLGEGDEARGYGKTRYLLWFADRVNEDLGRAAAKLAGRSPGADALVAMYASFSTVDGLSLSNLLFDAVRDLVGARHDTLDRLRRQAIDNGEDAAGLYRTANRILRKAGEPWSAGLLHRLCYATPQEWTGYLDDRYEFSQWHRVRYGRHMLRTAVAFLAGLGVPHVLILVDQVEDFAAVGTPAYKLRRDFPRLSHLCFTHPILRGRLTFVLTMHPRAGRVLSRYWPEGELGSIGVGGLKENVVCLGPMSRSRFARLVQTYLDDARVGKRSDRLHPFTEDVIDLVHELDRGRPGYCLRRLFLLLESALDEALPVIERPFSEALFAWRQDGAMED